MSGIVLYTALFCGFIGPMRAIAFYPRKSPYWVLDVALLEAMSRVQLRGTFNYGGDSFVGENGENYAKSRALVRVPGLN